MAILKYGQSDREMKQSLGGSQDDGFVVGAGKNKKVCGGKFFPLGAVLCATLLGTGISSSVFAQQQPVTGTVLTSGKIGVIDMQQVILNVEEGKKARAQLETEIKAKEAGLLKQKEELDKMNKEWKDQAPLLSEDARMKKQTEFQEKFLALRNAEMEYQAEIKRKEQKATQAIAMKVTQLVDSIAKSRKLVAVFETNSAGLLYLDSPIDLTQVVIAEYGKQPSPQQPVTKK
jgi:outer membrane protein